MGDWAWETQLSHEWWRQSNRKEQRLMRESRQAWRLQSAHGAQRPALQDETFHPLTMSSSAEHLFRGRHHNRNNLSDSVRSCLSPGSTAASWYHTSPALSQWGSRPQSRTPRAASVPPAPVHNVTLPPVRPAQLARSRRARGARPRAG